MKILIVDDSNDKIAKVISLIRTISDSIHFDISVDFVSALASLTNTKYDLLILDLHLPIREGEEPNFVNANNLLTEISRKKTIISPNYIVCLTQYEESISIDSNIWPVVSYSAESNTWTKSILKLINHINKSQNTTINKKEPSIPTIFLEGNTDEIILKEAFRLFNPKALKLISFRSERSAGGASWVARQIIAWSYTLEKDYNGNYIKAVGLFDGDPAGLEAIKEISRVVKTNGVESTTFRTIKLSLNYAAHLRSMKSRGLEVPICLEEMFDQSVWKQAKERGWLELRQNPKQFIDKAKDWNSYEKSFKEFIDSINLEEEDKLYLSCIKNGCKISLADFICKTNEEKKKELFRSFEKLVEDISNYFGFNN